VVDKLANVPWNPGSSIWAIMTCYMRQFVQRALSSRTLKIKWYFKLGAKHDVQNGRHTFFWLNGWLGTSLLLDRCPNLFGYCIFSIHYG
jgi:hypothetical protein